MKSAKNEEYKCFLPSESDETIAQEQNPGEPAEVLLQNLFLPTKAGKQQCSYRLETYWSYEVCHGKYVRQYHEEKVKGGTQTTEYFLGKYDKPVSFDPEKVPKTRDEVKKKNIDGIQTTYWELVMDGGTACELKPGQGRRTKVHYICNPNAFHNEILSVTETSTCEYEIVILTSALCSSPLYAQKLDSETFGIPCQKIGDAPTVPSGYFEAVSSPLGGLGDILSKLSQGDQPIMLTIDTKSGEVKQVNQEELEKLIQSDPDSAQSDSKQLQNFLEKLENADLQDGLANAIIKEAKAQAKEIKAKVQESIGGGKVASKETLNAETRKILDEFLLGDYCLRGGQGWWRYEFCYGKHVKQYHEYPQENGKAKKPNDEVFVGKWDETVHLKYAEGKNVVKKSMTKVKQASTQVGKTELDEDGEKISLWNPDEEEIEGKEIREVELFYAGGDICDVTGKPREVVVRLKCKPSQTSLSLYLLEPKTCSYILGLESELLCSILANANENGLIDLD